MFANTPKPPYYAVIFTSTLKADDPEYDKMADLMVELASKQDGFLGIESARSEIGISVSYWRDLDAIKQWKAQTDHQVAQSKGKQQWYSHYITRISKVERDYHM
ncbi:antibiotic biosynthesis monooxygenase [Thalassotalea nanhaiensis]|uniref:Antibiotic biosynthesis monooxygenase n=1 Tax=Thalassotalea nanhaiensis TaxID=3065648 RepID=A0ABY9THS4_9GAMM|nr:antibiotic biosynthesis monooxygenase [Colwelliaceae bacterium SQ345]